MDHLLEALKRWYTVTVDKDGITFCGIMLRWDYQKRHVDLSMPGYIAKTLNKFQHPPPCKPQNSPHKHVPIHYSATVQTPLKDTSPRVNDKATKESKT